MYKKKGNYSYVVKTLYVNLMLTYMCSPFMMGISVWHLHSHGCQQVIIFLVNYLMR